MRKNVRLGIIFISFLFLHVPSVCSQEKVYYGTSRLVFDSMLVLESPLSKGSRLSLDKATVGVQIYKGGALPAATQTVPRMYTFKNQFLLDGKFDNSDISLFMGLTEYPYAIYLNGIEIFKQGRYTGNHYNSSMRAVHEVFLPPDLLRYPEANDLVLEIYPRTETSGLDILYIDASEKVSTAVFIRNFIGIGLIQGAFVLSLVIGIYFLILFIAEKKRQKNHLIFTFFCFSFFFATIAIATHHDTSNEILMENLSKFGLILSSTLILSFFMEFTGIFNKKSAPKIILYAVGLTAAGGALLQADKVSLTNWFSLSIFIIILPQMVLSVTVLVIAIFKNGQKSAVVLLASFAVMVGTVLHDIRYLSSDTLPFAWLTTYGYFAIVLAIFALLAQEQAMLYHNSLQSEADLIIDRSRIEKLNEELTRQKDSFFRFVPTEFLSLLGRNSAVDIVLGDSSLRYLTILFTDIRKFTAIAEGMMPMEIFEFLNKYLLRMEKAVKANFGFVDKYIGDGVMALYTSDKGAAAGSAVGSAVGSAAGPAVGRGISCADNSLKSALRIKMELYHFNKEIATLDMLPVQIGIGINTGEVTLGTVGSHNRLDTTVIGDAVNLASRLESLTKFYRTQNLVSEYTVNALDNPENFKLRLIDHVSVPGRTKPLKIYELLEPRLKSDALKAQTMEPLAESISLYLAGNFKEALGKFNYLSSQNRYDPIPPMYAERCGNYIKKSPGANWDGVFKIQTKEALLG